MGPNLMSENATGKRQLYVRPDELFRIFRSKRLKRKHPKISAADVSTSVKDPCYSQRDDGTITSPGFLIENPKSFTFLDSGSKFAPNEETKIGIENEEHVSDQSENSSSPENSNVKSSLRKKLFKAPGSRGYRRLLPYLVDMTKDNTCGFYASPSIRIPKTEKLGLGPHNSEDEHEGSHFHGLEEVLVNEEMDYGTELSHKSHTVGEPNLATTVLEETRSHEGLNQNENGLGLDGVDGSTEELSVSTIDTFDSVVPLDQPNFNGTNPESLHMVNAGDHKGEDGVELSANRKNENFSTLLSCEAMDMDQLNLSQSEEGTQLNNYDQERDINGGSSNRVVGSTKEFIQMTQPQMGLLCEPEMIMGENEENPKYKNMCLKNGLDVKRKAVLNPCSQRKVFIAPGSISYRRLPPSLMDVNIDNPYDSLEHSEGGLSLNRSSAILIPNADSSDKKLTLISAEKSIELQKPSNSENKSLSPVKQVISSIINDLQHAYEAPNSDIKTTPPANLSCFPGENGTIHRDDAPSNSRQGTKALDLEHVYQKSSQIEDSSASDNPVSSKGILRRNPRGCRGLCNCLHCTSFRLNADRAFELSRNQMLDAEEMALDLINELSGLRNMLNEYIIKSHGHVTAGINQVKEACTKALKAEESAKHRLQEMHCDLSAHCRIKPLERPRVRFANYVKEMVMPQVDF